MYLSQLGDRRLNAAFRVKDCQTELRFKKLALNVARQESSDVAVRIAQLDLQMATSKLNNAKREYEFLCRLCDDAIESAKLDREVNNGNA